MRSRSKLLICLWIVILILTAAADQASARDFPERERPPRMVWYVRNPNGKPGSSYVVYCDPYSSNFWECYLGKIIAAQPKPTPTATPYPTPVPPPPYPYPAP